MGKYIYEKGGQVCISGKWYQVLEPGCLIELKHLDSDSVFLEHKAVDTFAQDYEAPKPVTIDRVYRGARGYGLAQLSNGFCVEFTAQDLMRLESF